MAEILLKNVNTTIWNHLQQRASTHGRTAEEEAKAILAEALLSEGQTPWASVDAIYDRLAAAGRTHSDSSELLREDRGW